MSSLEQYLSKLPAEKLKQLAAFWGYRLDEAALKSQLGRLEQEGLLLDTMQSRQAARLAVSRLTPLELRAADVIGLLGRTNVGPERILMILQGEGSGGDEAQEAIRHLIELGIVEDTREVARLVKETSPGIRDAIKEMKSGRGIIAYPDLLEQQGPDTISRLIDRYELAGHLKRINAKSVAAELAEPEIIERGLEQVSDEAKKLYRIIAENGNLPVDVAIAEMQLEVPEFETLLRVLETVALAFDGFDVTGERIVFIPKEAQKSRKPSAPKKPAQKDARSTSDLPEEVEPPHEPYSVTFDLLWDMLIILNIIENGGVYMTQNEKFPKRSLSGYASALRGESTEYDIDRATIVMGYGLDLKLITFAPDGQLSVTSAGREWMKLDAGEQTRRLLEFWANHPDTYFFYSSYAGYYPLANEMIEARRGLLRWLQRCKAGVWYSIESLTDLIRKHDIYILRSKGRAGIKSIEQNWEQIEQPLFTRWIADSMAELGIVNLGMATRKIGPSEIPYPEKFEITDLGSAALNNTSYVTSDQPLVVQPNFEVIVFEFNAPALYDISPFCHPVSFDRVATFKLSKESVVRGAMRGLTAEQMQAALERLSQKPVPQNILYSLAEWASKLRRVRLSLNVVMETDDEETLHELESSKSARQRIARTLGPNAAIVKSGATIRQQLQMSNKELRRIAQALQKAGFTVEVDTSGET